MSHPVDPMRRWHGTFHPKPGETRPICSMCGDDWPCETQIAWSNPRETNNTPQPKGNPNANR